MIIYPAIDLYAGKCVRLYQGDFQQQTIYSLDPLATAEIFVQAGANWLHIIDLDAAKNPQQKQTSIIADIAASFNINIQTGGGIRTREQIEYLFNQGVERTIVGSMAVENKKEVSNWFSEFGAEKLVLALDIMLDKNNIPVVAIKGWQESSCVSLEELIEYYAPFGLRHLLCTNIALDGTLNGPDFVLYTNILKKYPFLRLQASGGISTLTDIITLRNNALSGVIIGRALYEKKFTISEVLAC